MTKWISHRGESLDAPENTLAAFRLAMERGSDGVETDIHLTADGILVCCHDADTKRTCGESRIIEETPFTELETLDASCGKEGFRGERIPRYAELLELLHPGKLCLTEIKENDPRVVPAFLEEIDRAGIAAEQIVMISFHKEIVRLCKVLRPGLRVQWLTGFRAQEDGTVSPSQETILDTLKGVRADGLDAAACRKFCDRSLIRAVQDAGYAVNVWTVDEEESARFYLSAGVDFITSNRAAGLRALFRGKDPER